MAASSRLQSRLSFWRTASGHAVDFVIEDSGTAPDPSRVRFTPNLMRPNASPSGRFSRPAMREANGSG